MIDPDVPAPPADTANESELRALVDAERTSAEHWRLLALRRSAALDALKQRPIVRAALAADRRTARVRAGAVSLLGRIRRTEQRGVVVLGAIPSRRKLAVRRARVAGAVADLPGAPPDPRTVSIVRTVPGETTAAEIGRAIDDVDGELVCLLASSSEPLDAGWLDRLAGAIGNGVVAATPLLLHPARPLTSATPHDLLVRAAGLEVEVSEGGVPLMRARLAGRNPDPTSPAAAVAAASAGCLLFDRQAYAATGGLTPLPDLDAAVIELCLRLRAAGGQVVCVPGAVMFDHRAVRSRAELAGPIDETGPAWRAVVDRYGPALVRTARQRADRDHAGQSGDVSRLRFAITVATPSAKVAHRWGDWHLAEALGGSLRRLGHEVVVQTAADADALAGRSCDVHLVLRGMAPVRRTPGQRHVLWVISHPEAVETSECDDADLVLVASARFAEALRQRTTTPVEVLLQATDPSRFHPRNPDPAHQHPVTVVAKSRDVLRPMVADAVAAGLRPAIYGSGWDGLVDPGLVVADYVPNEFLPVVYSSAGVVLNDHWDTMRAWGFVSNRVFDVLACGAPLISDHLPEIEELFGDAVVISRSSEELASAVGAALADPVTARGRAAGGRRAVIDAHTFDHRARALVDALVRHGLTPPRDPVTERGREASPVPPS